ncbi:MAG: hypothetical protein P4L53_15350 [Candidatus Obscuribacterales bacterium]|nr:hypothetical protein [Candidatus Obscuribacterales bacterium]
MNQEQQIKEHLKLARNVWLSTTAVCLIYIAQWNLNVHSSISTELPAHADKHATIHGTANTQSVTMEIADVVPRTDRKRSSEDVTLELTFRNKSPHLVSIPFYSTVGKGSYEENPRGFKILSNSKWTGSFGGCYASFKYKWSNAHGQPLEGSYETSAFISIPAGGEEQFQIPLKAPTAPGRYILEVHFNNQPLRAAQSTFNTKQNNGNAQYVALDNEALIDLSP